LQAFIGGHWRSAVAADLAAADATFVSPGVGAAKVPASASWALQSSRGLALDHATLPDPIPHSVASLWCVVIHQPALATPPFPIVYRTRRVLVCTASPPASVTPRVDARTMA